MPGGIVSQVIDSRSAINPRFRLPRPWLTAGVFVLLAVVSLFIHEWAVPFGDDYWGMFANGVDLDVYRHGSLAVVDGHRLYDGYVMGSMYYTYTPTSAVVFLPFAAVPFAVAHWTWTICIFVALYFCIMLCFRNLGYAVDWPLRIVAMSLVVMSLLLEPVRTTIWFGQINVFLMLMILWDLTRPEGSRLRGFTTGIAAGIKLTPLIYFVYLLAVRSKAAKWVVIGFVATGAVGFLCLPRDSWKYWSGTFLDSERVGPSNMAGNQSIRGLLANVGNTTDPNGILWAALVLAALALGIGAAVLSHRRGNELLAVTLMGLTATTVSPMSWGHHWVWVVPLIVICLHYVLQARKPAVSAAALVAALAIGAGTFLWPRYVLNVATLGRQWDHAYLTGLFIHNQVTWLHWLVYGSYVWVFVITAVVTVVIALRYPDKVAVRRHEEVAVRQPAEGVAKQ
jgi:alpha-1,2-mannosyltransferase